MSKNKKRIVVKIGTSILTGEKSASGDEKDSGTALGSLIDEICRAIAEGAEVLLVTSGAIGAGIKKLGWTRRPDDLRKKQAAAAVGQVSLMQIYQELFEKNNIRVAQLLLTRSDFEDRQRYLNARTTLLTLLEMGVVPVINENDTVATEEIQFGDNDRLSALVASKIEADLLIILSDVDGLLRSVPGKGNEIVPVISDITPEIEKLVWKGVKGALGTGGMASKLEAAKIATASGVTTVVANGSRAGVIGDILQGKSVGTTFVSMKSLPAKERWILFGAIPKGKVMIDPGAANALKKLNKSLLPAGVVGVKGPFNKGEVISVITGNDEEIARGVCSFSSDEIEKVKGKKSGEIRKTLGRASSSFEVIHRDSLVLLP